ncbi:MAG: hypothetical protein NDJ89_17175 [Oligoflexia bacterium]|nr:hypothetical protein [Oligoflexia bacterium]
MPLLAARKKTLTARTLPVGALGAPAREAMWALFSVYYENIEREVFERDLATKDQVILLRDREDGSIQGFSTLQVYRREIRGRRVVVVFSGDTVISPAYWGQLALQWAFFRYILKTKLLNPAVPVYWFLISKGYRTYLLLSRNFPEYWPRHDRATPEWQQAVLDALAGEKYGADWKPELGILRFERPRDRLRSGVAPIEAALLSGPGNADIRYFQERNPGHAQGDELCCLGRVDARLGFFYSIKAARKALGLR